MSKSLKKKTDEAGSFALEGMFLISSTIHEPKQNFNPEQLYGIHFNIDARVSTTRDMVFMYPHFFITDEQQTETYAEFKLDFRFSVMGKVDTLLPLNEAGVVGINQVFASTLNSIVYSTTRGVIYMALRGTHLHNAILPIVDPAILKWVDPPK